MAAVGSGRREAAAAHAREDLMYHARPPRGPDRPAAGMPLSPNLDALADRVNRLRPSHRDPEHFHVEKDEIARELRWLARQRE